ncbi:MAG TPA: MarR family winged helix-turn-helix transcriptional regulator [Pseudolabrys sp.]|jgi:DNA-binding MarR family transcriptional regulator|nr:MarR family winged helix-turn-helix transcriptional regulator [Pseudolabrys sp.]
MGKSEVRKSDQYTTWQPETDIVHHLLLDNILKDNPVPSAYRINYVANFYIGPLVANMEKKFKLTRPEWIVLFCLSQQPKLNAQQISSVTGRAKTSIAGAVKQLQRKKLITRKTDTFDSRRRVLHLTDAGRILYKSIIGGFIAREADMLADLDAGERRTLTRLLDKIIKNKRSWAKPY